MYAADTKKAEIRIKNTLTTGTGQERGLYTIATRYAERIQKSIYAQARRYTLISFCATVNEADTHPRFQGSGHIRCRFSIALALSLLFLGP